MEEIRIIADIWKIIGLLWRRGVAEEAESWVGMDCGVGLETDCPAQLTYRKWLLNRFFLLMFSLWITAWIIYGGRSTLGSEFLQQQSAWTSWLDCRSAACYVKSCNALCSLTVSPQDMHKLFQQFDLMSLFCSIRPQIPAFFFLHVHQGALVSHDLTPVYHRWHVLTTADPEHPDHYNLLIVKITLISMRSYYYSFYHWVPGRKSGCQHMWRML